MGCVIVPIAFVLLCMERQCYIRRQAFVSVSHKMKKHL